MINLETEIVASRHDVAAGMFYYTIARGGRRWTVGLPDADLAKYAGNKQMRRNHVMNALEAAMRGKADGED